MGRVSLWEYAKNMTTSLEATAGAAHETVKSEFDLALPDLSAVQMLGFDGHTLLMSGIVVCFFGLLFGLVTFNQLKNMPVHEEMRKISELIYETCKTYLMTQLKFIGILWLFIGAVIVAYFGPIHGKGF